VLEYNNFFLLKLQEKNTDKKSFCEVAGIWTEPGLGCNTDLQQQAMQQQFRPNTTIPISTNQLQYDAFATNNN
jgi:hypothetical protein